MTPTKLHNIKLKHAIYPRVRLEAGASSPTVFLSQRRINQENSETETDCFLVYVLIIQGWREWEIVLAPEPQFLIW